MTQKHNFYESSGFLTLFKRNIESNMKLFASYLKVEKPRISLKVSFNIPVEELILVYTRVTRLVLQTTDARATSRFIRDLYAGKSGKGKKQKSDYQLFAIDLVHSIVKIVQVAIRSNEDASVLENILSQGPISKLVLFIIQFVRGVGRTHVLPYTNLQLNFDIVEVEYSNVKPMTLAEALDHLRTFDILCHGNESGLVKVHKSHLSRVVPGFMSCFILRKDNVVEVVRSNESTIFDTTFAYLLGVTMETYDKSSNYANAISQECSVDEITSDWHPVIEEFLYHISKFEVGKLTVLEVLPFDDYTVKSIPIDDSVDGIDTQ